ncbi:MAG: sensor histidine kinase [Micromonosporaceae bacterium]|nr:sensor histidine kinase [Micromonosporaceae bacterium]
MTLAVAVVIAADRQDAEHDKPLAYLFALAFGALMFVRRRFPRLVLVLTVLSIFVYYAFDFPPIGIALPAVAALYSGAEADRTRWAIGAGLVLIGVSSYFRIEEGLPTAYLLSYELLTNVALVAAAIALGASVRLRRESQFHQERLRVVMAEEQAREAERRVQAERVRIARDLHDVVGHTMSVIAVHGNVAAEAVGRDDEAVRRALDQIRQATNATINELRSTVKILRAPGTDVERGAIGVAGLSRLVDGAREAGIEVELAIDLPGTLDGAIDAAVYRVVQESLTNVIRHSGAKHASVVVRADGGRLEIVIRDDGRGPAPVPGGPGTGLVGMRERVTMLGGQFFAGRGEDGGFVVRAVLPMRLDV